MNAAISVQTATRPATANAAIASSRLFLILPGQAAHRLDHLPALLADGQRIEKIGRVAARPPNASWIELPPRSRRRSTESDRCSGRCACCEDSISAPDERPCLCSSSGASSMPAAKGQGFAAVFQCPVSSSRAAGWAASKPARGKSPARQAKSTRQRSPGTSDKLPARGCRPVQSEDIDLRAGHAARTPINQMARPMTPSDRTS